MRGTALAVALAGILSVATGSATAGAQTVQGTVIDAEDGSPISGAFVVLVDAAGEDRARGLTTRSGAYRLSAPGAGTYRIRVERIGFEGLSTEAFELAVGEAVSRRLEVAVRPVTLAAIEVTGGEARCGTPADEALELGSVWEEARKALAATAWTDRQSYYRFDVLLFRQELDPRGEPVAPPEHESIRVYGRHPFRSARPEDLAYGGWVQRQGNEGLKFWAPDAEVMLSESFLRLHCFRLVRSESDPGGLLGLEFEPAPGRRAGPAMPDVTGVLWIDRESAELRSLQYRYTDLRLPVETDLLGGRVEFDHLPDGGWIVRSWEIRTPLAQLREFRSGNRRQQEVRLSGMRLEGRRVLAVWRTGDVQASPNLALPADVPAAHAPPDQLLRRYPADSTP